ncbi:unnamed protein product [Anisakis simplex]|uniref:Organ specific protein n=1 Tax=Anisakis simplex TaxID=6269 RepID=A0A0M3KJH4_ANISI|nr:unnamed protein product [Anisakis simplex]
MAQYNDGNFQRIQYGDEDSQKSDNYVNDELGNSLKSPMPPSLTRPRTSATSEAGSNFKEDTHKLEPTKQYEHVPDSENQRKPSFLRETEERPMNENRYPPSIKPGDGIVKDPRNNFHDDLRKESQTTPPMLFTLSPEVMLLFA